MRKEWKEVRLGDVVVFNYGKSLISTNRVSGSVPVYSSAGITGFHNKPLVESAGIIVGRKGSVGTVYYSPIPFFCIDTAYYILPSENFDLKYMYYRLCSLGLEKLNEDSAVPGLNRDTAYNQRFSIPPLIEQRTIAATLSCLDEKIELNSAINHHLTLLAQTMFDSFVSKNESKSVELQELCSFQEGYVNPSQNHPEYFDGTVKWLRAVDINESFIIDTSRTLSQLGYESAGKSAYLFKPDTIVISKSGTIGRLGIVSDFMCGNRAVINIIPNDKRLLPFIHLYLKSRQSEFPNLAVGSVQKNLYVSLLQPLIVELPHKDDLLEFCDCLRPIYEQIKYNVKESNTMRRTRDTLLPRLMSGELSVANLNAK
jgi:type I restriction enzyme S subunit